VRPSDFKFVAANLGQIINDYHLQLRCKPPMTDLQPILDRYPPDCRPLQIHPLGTAGGFSGAQLWRITAPRGELALRRWPKEHPTQEGLRFIHKVLRHAAEHGISFVPVSATARDGESFVEQTGYLWELAPWMPGEADYERSPSDAKLQAAMATLAQFHVATANFVAEIPLAASRPSPAISRRLDQLQKLSRGSINELSQSLRPGILPELLPLARQFLTMLPTVVPLAIARLQPLATLPFPMQPCLRDIWHDHVLFTGNTVSGLVDFGAMQIETPAGDVARLLGSLAADDRENRNIGLAAYAAIRPLSPAELQAITAFDTSGILLSGANWLRWIHLEDRTFDNHEQVIQRFRKILERTNRLPTILPHSGDIS
jgi:Ser/Thr protein kinase RdoA (MazF antagonist)